MVVFTCTLCQTDFNTRNAIERHQKNKHEQVDKNKNEGTEIGQAHVSLEGGTETQSGVEMDIDENGTEDTPNICEILTDIVAFDYLNDMWNKYEDALPQLMKHIYSIFDNKCNRRSGMKRHQTKKHALVNRKHIKTNNATTIPRQFVKALNINGKSRNVYPDDEKPRKKSGLRRVKTKSGGRNLAVGVSRRKDILDDDDDEYQMIKLFKCNFCSYSSERKRNVTRHMEKHHTLPNTMHIKKETSITPK